MIFKTDRLCSRWRMDHRPLTSLKLEKIQTLGEVVTHPSQTCYRKTHTTGIDTPELKLPRGREAKAQLASMVMGKDMQAVVTEGCR
jgi:hypothetical protein